MPTVSPRRQTSRTIAKEVTRQGILAAAHRLFIDRAYEASTVRDISKAAGRSTGAFFASFSSKEEALLVILELEHQDELASMEFTPALFPGNPRLCLTTMIQSHYAFWQVRRNLLTTRFALRGSSEQFDAYIARANSVLALMFAKVLEDNNIALPELRAKILLAVHFSNLEVLASSLDDASTRMSIEESLEIILPC